MHREAVLDLLHRDIGAEEYREIRELWKAHSLAEDARDLAGLIATLTEDCSYEMPQAGKVWEGHEGARKFYLELLTAFPDIHFDLTNIVIGPQGVYEEAAVTATHQGTWLNIPATGEGVTFTVIIFFPWDQEAKLFKGERVYVDSYDQLMASSSG